MSFYSIIVRVEAHWKCAAKRDRRAKWDLWNGMLIETRTDKIVAASATVLFFAMLLLAGVLQYNYGGALFFQRVIAGIAGCF